MRRLAIACSLALFGTSAFAGDPAPPTTRADAGYRLLFASAPKTLSDADEREIFAQTGLLPNGRGGLSAGDCGDVEASVEITDLNRDGTSEVFVLFGNTCTSGITGSSLLLFVRDATGHFRANLGFPAAAYTPLSVGRYGFPDLEIGGAGFCDGIWRWDGTSYQFRCNHPTGSGGCDMQGRQCPDGATLVPRDQH